MIATAALVERYYSFQGATIVVASEDPDVAVAVDYRLRDFRIPPAPEDLRLEFGVGIDADQLSSPGGEERRPVYDTPAGQVSYRPVDDVLEARFGGVQLFGMPDRGLSRISSERYESEDLYLAAHPLTMIGLSELLKRRGRYSLHAACVSREERGVLIAGPSGAGKSTLVLALARMGLGFLSDDMVFLEHGGSAIDAHGFSDAIGVTQSTSARFDELCDLAAGPPPPGFRKHLVRIEERFAVRGLPRCRPDYLIFPELTPDQDSELEPMEPEEAWLRLVPDVLLTHPASTQAHLTTIAELTRQVACYRLRSGPDVGQSAELIGTLIR